jgi:uncharacterized membrane protein YbhN (UPF0104 family)
MTSSPLPSDRPTPVRTPSPERRRLAPRLARLAGAFVTVGLLVLLFRRIPFAQVWDSLRSAAPWTVPVLTACVLLVYVADCFATWKTFSWFAAPLTFRETLLVRGSSYPLAAVNYAVGQGALAFFLHRTRGLALRRCAATVLLVMGINVLALLALTTVAALTGAQLPTGVIDAVLGPVRRLGLDVAPATALVALWLALLAYAVVVALRPAVLRSRPVFDVLLSAGLSGHLKALAVRLPHVGCLITFSYISLRAFGVSPPIGDAVLLLPMVYFVAVLPISVQGLGVMEAAMVLVFQKYAPGDGASAREAIVFAASLASHVLAVVVQVAVGLVCLRNPAMRALSRDALAASSS